MFKIDKFQDLDKSYFDQEEVIDLVNDNFLLENYTSKMKSLSAEIIEIKESFVGTLAQINQEIERVKALDSQMRKNEKEFVYVLREERTKYIIERLVFASLYFTFTFIKSDEDKVKFIRKAINHLSLETSFHTMIVEDHLHSFLDQFAD